MTTKPKILIIEDNAVNAKLLTVYLEAEGFEVLHASDGGTGIKMVADHRDIVAVLLDRIMPDMDGLEVLKTIKRGSTSWSLPVIMLTAALSTQQIEEVKLFGAYACLPKPYNKDKIVEMVNKAIRDPR